MLYFHNLFVKQKYVFFFPLSFQAFAQLLQVPHDEAQAIIRERFPVPRLVVCDQHGSQVKDYFYLNIVALVSVHMPIGSRGSIVSLSLRNNIISLMLDRQGSFWQS